VLAKAGILRQVSAAAYDRQYAADELFELIEDYEASVYRRGRRSVGMPGTSVSQEAGLGSNPSVGSILLLLPRPMATCWNIRITCTKAC